MPSLGSSVVLLLGAQAALASSSQVPRFEARVEVVKVSVLVKGDGKPTARLEAADFEVRDNGVAQEVEGVLREEAPMSAILAFDVSGSVYGEKLEDLKRASHALADGLLPGDRAALVTFADRLSLRPLQPDMAPLRAQIDALEAGGGTSLVDGTFAAMALGDAVPGRVLAMVFTDGEETASWILESYALDAARRTEVVVYGVRVGWDEEERFLGRVASTTGGRLLQVDSSDRLRKAFLEILEEFRARYVLRYTPRGVKREGWHRLDIRVKGRSAKVTARKGYLVSP